MHSYHFFFLDRDVIVKRWEEKRQELTGDFKRKHKSASRRKKNMKAAIALRVKKNT
jgi:hypothetical protein